MSGTTPVRKARAPLRGGLPTAQWNRLSPVEKLQLLYGYSLDSCLRALTWTEEELAANPHRMAAHTSARHDVMMLCTRWGIEMHRDKARSAVLEILQQQLSTKGESK